MLRFFERLFLEFVRWFYTTPESVGVIVLGGLGIGLVLYQFTKGNKNPLPGVFGIFFLIAEYYHFVKPEKTIEGINYLLGMLQTPSYSLKPVPVIEFLFSTLVAPVETRFIGEECFILAFLIYAFLAFRTCIQEYKKTGVIIGDLSIQNFFSPKIQRPNRSHSNELGSGDLATTDLIAPWTKGSNPELDTSLAVTDLRGSEGISFKTARIVWPSGERNRHILIVAKTGSGKTTKMILPVLYNDCMSKVRSTIVIDSKPEMWQKLAAMTAKYNPEKNILLFNPLDTARSLSWNILGKIQDPTDCKLIANTIIMATDQPTARSDSPFFRNNALAVLNAIMVGLLDDQEKKKDVLSMPRVHQIVQGGGVKYLCDWLSSHEVSRRTTQTFIDLVRSGSQNADTIMSELSMRISQWDLPAIRATTSKPEIDLEDLIKKPTLFIVEFRESEIEMLRPMANVIVVELLRYLTKAAESEPGVTLPRPVSLVIDEFASALGRLPDIHVKLNTLRSRNVSIVGSIQSTAQVKAIYETNADSVLAGFSTKIFMPALDQTDSEWASKETGQMTIRFKTRSLGSNRKIIEWFASKNDSTQEQVQQRAVLTPDEIGRPIDNISTFFMPNTPVFQGHLVPYYKIPELRSRIAEFDSPDKELKVRHGSDLKDEEVALAEVQGASTASAAPGGLPAGISNVKGWTEDQIKTKLEEVKKKLDWENTTGSARKWWEAFENENKHRVALVLRLAEELQNRKATITEFFLAYVYSNTDNIQANLHYLDYTRLKKEEERKRREAAAAKAGQPGGAGATTPPPAAASAPPSAPPSASAPPSTGKAA